MTSQDIETGFYCSQPQFCAEYTEGQESRNVAVMKPSSCL
jgi:hypothetical protein